MRCAIAVILSDEVKKDVQNNEVFKLSHNFSSALALAAAIRVIKLESNFHLLSKSRGIQNV